MKRELFIKEVENILDISINEHQFFDFQLNFKNEQTKSEITKTLYDKLNLHFDASINSEGIIKCEPDWMAMEDEDDWIYSIQVNPHVYYDKLSLSFDTITLYRLENKSGKGIYYITGGDIPPPEGGGFRLVSC